MKGLLKKFRENKKGFTLAELLVVVAIVAILVAISVPIFTAQLGKARKATNEANLRAAKVAAITAYMTDDKYNNGNSGTTVIYKYDISEGTVNVSTDSLNGFATVKIGGTGNYRVATSKVYKEIYVEVTSKVAGAATNKDEMASEADVDVVLRAN